MGAKNVANWICHKQSIITAYTKNLIIWQIYSTDSKRSKFFLINFYLHTTQHKKIEWKLFAGFFLIQRKLIHGAGTQVLFFNKH